jgi:hypothetical protein
MVRYFKLNNAFIEKIKVDLAKRELENGQNKASEFTDTPTRQPAH